MSHLMISRLLKPSVFKTAFRHRNARLFSSTPTYPFLLIDYLINNPNSLNLGSVYDEPNCSKQKEIVFYDDPKLRDEVIDAMTSRLPYHIILKKTTDYDNSSLRIVIHHNQGKADVRVYLPPLPIGSKIQNIAMSSLPYNQDKEDWVVGVKLPGSRLSFCRPFSDSKWINLKAMPESINPYSSLMFSKKDQKFYIPSTGGNNLCSFDLHFKEEDEPKFIYLGLHEDSKSEDLGLYSRKCFCSRTNHLVELPTGEILLVQWYGEDSTWAKNDNGTRTLMHKTKHFMVFREEKWGSDFKNMVYTKDIGDFCIFLGYSEAFCVRASSSPGLKPNCIYFVGYSFGVYDLTTETCTNFLEVETSKDDDDFDVLYPLRNLKFPYWPPPVPLH
ncbi:hypothetical protein V5N11_011500 [Cardamine amara subsp. amara]|uniref:KIB1-4 beta-propeller domain-containing protein n=1 Tax=Cardamine amara subsp. amara TaxID=228776 RepID=A0ABD1B855_CARAN